MMTPIIDKEEIKIAMLGMVDGNGHPYSWSAMFNGYNPEYMKDCPFPTIPDYLSKEPAQSFGIPGAKVTHIWTDDPIDAEKVAKASNIPNIAKRAQDVIGEVDAVIIATDKGHEHVDRCRPFVEAGLPMFVDKPMVDNERDLKIFCDWIENGANILSSSSMRYTKEFMPYRLSTNNLGELRYVSMSSPKSWERYGIHALEAVYAIVGPGFLTVQNTGARGRNIVHLTHEKNIDINLAVIEDMSGGFGALELLGTKGMVQTRSGDSFYSFKKQLECFVEYLRTGAPPFPFTETVELMKIIIAGIRSREDGGRRVALDEI